MINVSRAINDTRFVQPFTVYRKSGGEWVNGRWEQSENPIQLSGVISIAKEKDLQMIPEGDRIGGAIVIHSTQELFITHKDGEAGTSDEILWRNERYKLISVNTYADYGYYKAIGIRKVSN